MSTNLPEMHTVQSSQVAKIGWSDETLFVLFHSGGLYKYENVTQELFDKLRNAVSVGKVFQSLIKANPAKHPFTKITQ